MRRLLAVWVVALGAAWTPLGMGQTPVDALCVEANLQPETGNLEVRIACPRLPPRSLVTLRLLREPLVPSVVAPLPLLEQRVVFQSAGRAQTVLEAAGQTDVPGRYRLYASFEPAGQWPHVLEAVGNQPPGPADVVIQDSFMSIPYIKSLWGEAARIESSFAHAQDLIARLREFEAGVGAAPPGADRRAAVATWESWRREGIPVLEGAIRHGREVGGRWFSDTHARFTEGFLFGCLYQWESRRFAAVRDGHGFSPPAAMAGQSELSPDVLLPLHTAFRREQAVLLSVLLRSLVDEVAAEASRQRPHPDLLAWAARRERWESLLCLLEHPLTGPAALVDLPQQETLLRVVAALRPWWDSEEAFLSSLDGPAQEDSGAEESRLREELRGLESALGVVR